MKIERCGISISLFTPDSIAERRWLHENTDGTWWCGSLVVEQSYAPDLLAGVQDAGFTVEGDCLKDVGT
jgi:hypothetical protein